MWISNTATTALMVPIVEAVIQELYKVFCKKRNNYFAYLSLISIIGFNLDEETSNEIPPEGFLTADESSSNNSTVILSDSKEGLVIDPVIILVNSLTLTPRQQVAEAKRKKKIRVGTLMAVAYASNIGGTGSQIGSGPQLALKGILQQSVA